MASPIFSHPNPHSEEFQAAQNPALVKLRQAEPALEAARCRCFSWEKLVRWVKPGFMLVSMGF